MVSTTISFLVADEAPAFSSELSSIYNPDALKQADNDKSTDESSSTQTGKQGNTKAIDGKDVQFPLSGEHYGQITCDEIGLNAPVYWYDDDEILAYGVGQSLISNLPGFGEVIILSGHNNTFFACLQNAAVGNVIKFGTNYCDYEYTVTNVQVYNENDLEDLLIDKTRHEKEELILYTCYPFHAITGRKTDRLVVFADRTAGRDVIWKEETK